jgi:DNA-directed RNA polymerase specialized sigma24 family protein
MASAEEVRRIDELERERIDDVTRYALLDAIERYPSPRKLFPWLRESLAYRAVDFLRSELSVATPNGMYRDEADALEAALHGLDDVEAPRFNGRQRPRRDLWQMRELFAVAGDYAENTAVRRVILKAVGRLAPAQRWAVEEFHLRGQPAQTLASQRGVTESTIYNTTAAARRKLQRDDEFFSALHGLGAVRDEARIKAIRTRYPDGRLPDGRRVVVITEAD